TGAMYACDHEGVVPDLVGTAKGVADGLPRSAVTGRAGNMDAGRVGGVGGAYGGNPIACAGALAPRHPVEAEGRVDRARRVGEVMTARLAAAQARDARIGDVRGRGAMVAVELVDPATGAPDAGLTGRVAAAVRACGVVVLTCGTDGNVLRFLPPLSIPDHLLDEGLGVVEEVLVEL